MMWPSVAAALLVLSQGWLSVEGGWREQRKQWELAEAAKQAERDQKFPQRPTCVQWKTMPENEAGRPDLWSTLTTPGWCLEKCVAKNFTYAGVQGALCRCDNISPAFARVPLSECSWDCEVDRTQTCGGPGRLSVVGPGYPSVPAYCAHDRTLEHSAGRGEWHGSCIEECASSGNYSFAGLIRDVCYCGAREPPREWEVEESRCSASCDYRVPKHGCGGEDVISVYQLNTIEDTEEEEAEDDTLSLTTSSSSTSSVGKDQ